MSFHIWMHYNLFKFFLLDVFSTVNTICEQSRLKSVPFLYYCFWITFYKWSSWAKGPTYFYGSRNLFLPSKTPAHFSPSVLPVISVTILATVSNLTGKIGTSFNLYHFYFHVLGTEILVFPRSSRHKNDHLNENV